VTADDPLAPLTRALDGTGEVVAGIAPDQWELPTPCTDWTVRQVLNHLVGGNRLATRVLRGEQLPPPDQLGRRSGQDQLGADPTEAYRGSAADLVGALGAPGVLERAHTLPVGTLPGPAVVHLRTVVALVHGWDLALGIGRPAPFPDELAEAELGFSRDLLGRIPEGRRPFAPSVPVPDDAPAIERLVALLGRTP
jgi:uncharacterized protein (TIGR03086 family)